MQVVMVSAWESSDWFWNDVGHGIGAFLTSAGFAGLTAVGAACIAAWQVSKTRSADKEVERSNEEARRRDEAAKRRDQLWQRFEWVADNQETLGAAATAQMLVGLEAAAKAEGDTNLAEIIATVRRRVVRQSAPPTPDQPGDQ